MKVRFEVTVTRFYSDGDIYEYEPRRFTSLFPALKIYRQIKEEYRNSPQVEVHFWVRVA